MKTHSAFGQSLFFLVRAIPMDTLEDSLLNPRYGFANSDVLRLIALRCLRSRSPAQELIKLKCIPSRIQLEYRASYDHQAIILRVLATKAQISFIDGPPEWGNKCTVWCDLPGRTLTSNTSDLVRYRLAEHLAAYLDAPSHEKALETVHSVATELFDLSVCTHDSLGLVV